MSNQNEHLKKDTNFEEQIRDSYREKTADRSDCPAPDDLVRYHHRELSPEEMLRIQQHVSVCGFCDCEVAGLAEFNSVASSVLQPDESSRKGILIRFLLHPAFAFAIVLALLYPAYRGLFTAGPASQKIVDRAGSAMDFDLGQGSATRSTSPDKEAVVVLSRAERFFILTFFVPVRSAYRYEMEIRNEEGKVVDSEIIRSRDPLGNFSVVAASSQFPDGRYSLTVKEIEPAAGTVKDQYHFQFRVDRKQNRS